jgi:oxygen-independent coproporphyrinogen-3 oxidase
VFHSRPPPLPDEDAAFAIQHDCQQLLAAEGFAQYEVSGYARPGARCRHNLNYWTFGDYVGIGAGAHGKLTFAAPDDIVRTEKPRQPREYLERLEALPDEPLTSSGAADALGVRCHVPRRDLPFEFMLNALRLNEGFAICDFEHRTGLPAGVVEPALRRALGRGLMETTPQGWRPTELGLRFLNDLQAGFLE